MPKLFTNNGAPDPSNSESPDEQSKPPMTYQEYLNQRTIQENVTEDYVLQQNASFMQGAAVPAQQNNPSVQMGEYFVIPVTELRQMLDSGDNPDFIHVYNALKSNANSNSSTAFTQSTILVPVKKVTNDNGAEVHVRANSANTFYIEAYSCPPDKRCPPLP